MASCKHLADNEINWFSYYVLIDTQGQLKGSDVNGKIDHDFRMKVVTSPGHCSIKTEIKNIPRTGYTQLDVARTTFGWIVRTIYQLCVYYRWSDKICVFHYAVITC